MRQPLREFCDEAAAPRDVHRPALAVASCCIPRLRWVWPRWRGTPLALALDATTLGTRFTVLAVSVVSRSGAMPVAWDHPAGHPAPCLAPRVATEVVSAAAGHASPLDGERPGGSRVVCWLAVSTQRPGGLACLVAHQERGHISPRSPGALPPVDQRRTAPGPVLAGHRDRLQEPAVTAPVPPVGRRGRGLDGPLTDLPPDASEAGGAGRRAGIAPQGKCLQRAGWPWQRTRLTPPDRAARRWLAGAPPGAAPCRWGRQGGTPREHAARCDHGPGPPAPSPPPALGEPRSPRVEHDRGRAAPAAPLPCGTWLPEPWPQVPPRAVTPVIPAPEVHHAMAA